MLQLSMLCYNSHVLCIGYMTQSLICVPLETEHSMLQHLVYASANTGHLNRTGEARRWLRSGRYSRKAVATPTPADSVRIEAEAAAEQVRFDQLKEQLQTWCLGTALVCFAATVVFYSKVCRLLLSL